MKELKETLALLSLPVTYKDYPSLCSAIGFPVASGNTKAAQLKLLEANYVVEKAGRSITLVSRKEEAIVLPQRKTHEPRNDSIYCSIVSVGLLDYLAPNVDGDNVTTVYLSTSEAAEVAGLVNSEYKNLPLGDQKDTLATSQFKSEVRNKVKDCLRAVYSSLTRQNILLIRDTYLVQRFSSVWDEADKETCVRIMDIKRRLLDKYGAETEGIMFLKKSSEAYKRDLYKELKSELGLSKCKRVKSMSFTKQIRSSLVKYKAELAKAKTNKEIIKYLGKRLERFLQRTPFSMLVSGGVSVDAQKKQAVLEFEELVDVFIRLEGGGGERV